MNNIVEFGVLTDSSATMNKSCIDNILVKFSPGDHELRILGLLKQIQN